MLRRLLTPNLHPPLFLLTIGTTLALASPTLNIEQRQDPNPFPTVTGPDQASLPGPTVTVSPSASASGTSNDKEGGGSGIALEIILPIIVLLAAGILLVIIINYRVQVKAFLRKHFGLPVPANGLPHTSTHDSSRALTAEQLSGHTTPTPAANSSNAGDDNARARDRRTRRERNVRRTESGRSVRTLPVYSKEAGDEELVLVRQRSRSSFSDGSYFDQDVTDSLGDAERGLLASDRRPRSLSVRSNASRRRSGSQEPRSDDETGDAGDIPLSTVRVGDETSETLLSPLVSPVSRFPQSAPLPRPRSSSRSTSSREEESQRQSQEDQTVQSQSSMHRSDTLGRRGWGEAPTYLEAMSSPLPPSAYLAQTPSPVSANVPPPRDLRTRTSSTFRGLLSKAGFTYAPSRHDQQMSQSRTSSTSLLLQPTTSRLSSMSFRPNSPGSSPGASTLSLVISSPIPDTAVRASFDSARLPKAGLSDDQMRFLGSKEALNLAGVKLNNVPDNKKRRRRSEALSVDETLFGGRSRGGSVGSSSGARAWDRTGLGAMQVEGSEGLRRDSESSAEFEEGQALPPSWEQSENRRRQNQAFERRNLAKPVYVGEESGQSSGVNLDNRERLDRQEAESSSVDLAGHPGLGTAATTPLPPSPADTTHTASPIAALSLASTSTPTPALEIEPPTPIVSTPPPPPQPLSAAGRS
ncbi:hypothetical protein I316_07930 [Kwoniella heveanensis BCC8398]|uniref:Uncharacterized protein n=1 Tax=Kwoniella heveanensis BCC8398 TaxID=1296120 RepID=A0A1B9GHC9_9TREE|nr:hypothetical protein I316_07930 [Kwoniella heveanensis BCC8398]